VAATWTVVDGLSGAEQEQVAALLDAIERRTGDEALTESQRERLEAGEHVRHALRRDAAGVLTGYAVIAIEETVAAEPAYGTFDFGLAHLLENEQTQVTLLLRTVEREVESHLGERGWRPLRTLHRLRRGLPAPPPPASHVTVRPFVPGLDDEAWVELNNEAFAHHPSQGDMTVARLRARFKESWFDPAGFRMYFDGERLVASCWTKVHRTSEGDVGEIYVVAVAPSAQGQGLGRYAVLEGLAHLSAGGATEAELYVEETNRPAYALYEALGFEYASRIVQFARDPTPPIQPDRS
jgi:mycothiol synthase